MNGRMKRKARKPKAKKSSVPRARVTPARKAAGRGGSLKTPFADLLPPLSTEEFDALKASIQAEGVRDAVVIDEDGNILDGHHRYAVDPNAPTRVLSGLTGGEKRAYVFQANFARRNLSPEQKRAAREAMQRVAKVLRQENPKKNTQKRVAALLGVDQSQVSRWLGSDMQSHNTSATSGGNGRPDARVKVSPQQRPVVRDRVHAGEPVAQVAADFGVSERQVRTIATQERKTAEVKARREQAAKKRKGNCGVIQGDFRVGAPAVEEGSIDLIFTDPPYNEPDLYADVATFASAKLTPGGWLLAYSGKSHLDAVFRGLSKATGLTYGWTFCIFHRHAEARFRKFKVRTAWKPVVGFYKPPLWVDWDWFRDVTSGGKEKADHPWQQAVAEAEHFIEALCPKGGMVFDPCCGSGTSLLAAKRLGRKWLGYEIDPEHAETARSRLDDTPL